MPVLVQAGLPSQDAALLDRIDTFVAEQAAESGIPGVAIAVLQDGRATHVRGFGHDGRGHAITGDTPFPIGSLTKSFTALLVQQAIDAGQLEVDAPVQRYLPWFRVADPQASRRITLRHLLNQTSGFSRADGIAPLLQRSRASLEELARGMAVISLGRMPGERFEYSNLNYVLLGAVLQEVTGKSWDTLVRERVLQPLAMTHSHTDHASARRDGMTALHRMWFGLPVAHESRLPPAFASSGGLAASVADMARYLQMMLAGGVAPDGSVVSARAARRLLEPASPPSRSILMSTEFRFSYGGGWFVGPFGAADDACWHLGNLASFAAWMVLLPDTKQAVVMLINANAGFPLGKVDAVMSRLPIGVVNLLRGQPVPQGPGLRLAYAPIDAAAALAIIAGMVLAWWSARAPRAVWSLLLAVAAIAITMALRATGLTATFLAAFAPDLALVLAVVLILLCLPAVWRGWLWVRRPHLRGGGGAQR